MLTVEPTLAVTQRRGTPDRGDIQVSAEIEERQPQPSSLQVRFLRMGINSEVLETLSASGGRVPVLLLRMNLSSSPGARDIHPLVQAVLRSLDSESDLSQPQPTPAAEGMRADGPMTARERAVLQRIGQGLSNKKIARDLNIAPETVKSHTKHIFCKLGTNTRAQAVAHAARLGLL